MRAYRYPKRFLDLFDFLCNKYSVDRGHTFVEYSSDRPPDLKGGTVGYYEGLLSFRQMNGRPEFLITVFSVSRDPLLTLAHEFAHLIANLKTGDYKKNLQVPNDSAEKEFDVRARNDVAEFEASVSGRAQA